MTILLLVACQQPATGPTGPIALVSPPTFAGQSYTYLFSDEELGLMERLHSSPGADIKLTSGVHVQLFDQPKRLINIDLDSGAGIMPQLYSHVRVLDGPSRGMDGWVANQHLKTQS
jgi:hypothetical protein